MLVSSSAGVFCEKQIIKYDSRHSLLRRFAGNAAVMILCSLSADAMFTPTAVWTVGLVVLPPLCLSRLPWLNNLPRCLNLLALFAAREVLVAKIVCLLLAILSFYWVARLLDPSVRGFSGFVVLWTYGRLSDYFGRLKSP